MVFYGGFVEVRYYSFSRSFCVFSLFLLSMSFLCSRSRVFSSIPVFPIYLVIFSHIFIYSYILSAMNNPSPFRPRATISRKFFCVSIDITCFVIRLIRLNSDQSPFSDMLKGFEHSTAALSLLTGSSYWEVFDAEC